MVIASGCYSGVYNRSPLSQLLAFQASKYGIFIFADVAHVGPPSTTLAQHGASIGSGYHVQNYLSDVPIQVPFNPDPSTHGRTYVGFMLGQRLRRWPNIKPTLSQCTVLTVEPPHTPLSPPGNAEIVSHHVPSNCLEIICHSEIDCIRMPYVTGDLEKHTREQDAFTKVNIFWIETRLAGAMFRRQGCLQKIYAGNISFSRCNGGR